MNIVIIGGSDAGISAALRLRELNETANVKLLLADDFPNFSICGLPFYLSGETPDWKQLAHRTEFDGIEVLRSHRAKHIDAAMGVVLAKHEGRSKALSYDRLIIGTGAVPVRPSIEGLGERGVFLLHTMENSFRISKRFDVFATALFHGMTVEGLNELDLSYTPPLSSPWDPVQMSAQAWSHAVRTQQPSQEIVNA